MDTTVYSMIGATLGIAAFLWKLRDLFKSYLHIDLSVEEDNYGHLSAKTVVQNKHLKIKNIDNAVLLIGPENEEPETTYNQLVKNLREDAKVCSSRGIAVNKYEETLYGEEGRMLIPLPFYYRERGLLEDEEVSCRVQIDTSRLNENSKYSVRFYLWGTGRVHRVTHDSFCFVQNKNL